MDERNLTSRTTDVRSEYDRDVDIRRTAILGRDYDASGNASYVAVAPMTKALRWGPIFAGLATSMALSLLFGSLFLGLGFDRSYGVFGGLTAGDVGWGAAIATILAVFCGAYLAGYASDLRARAEGTINGFMVGITSILAPLVIAIFTGTVAGSAAMTNLPETADPAGTAATVGRNVAAAVPNAVETNIRSALVVAADNAWTVFFGGLAILAIATMAGYLGAKSREKTLEAEARHDLERARTY